MGASISQIWKSRGSLTTMSYAPRISRRDNTLSIRGRMPNSPEMAGDSSGREMALA